MSLPCSDCFTDLLCCEESSEIFSGESPECSSDLESSACIEESIASFIEDERNFVPGFDYLSRFQSRSLDASAREESVAWILKVKTYYRFQPLTAYLSVNYLDRFLYSRPLPQANGWPMHLLAVACLSLAAKMEEALVPSLLDLQVEGAKYIFEPRTIRRMELLVLTVLDWRLRSVTPFSFLGFFACKIDPTGTYIGFLISRATEIILSNMQEASFLEYWPSSIAAAAILCAANEIPNLSLANPEHAESWCDGLSKVRRYVFLHTIPKMIMIIVAIGRLHVYKYKLVSQLPSTSNFLQEKIIGCYQLMQDLVLDNSRRKPPKVLPLLRVTIRARTRSLDSSSSPSSSSSSSSSYKRRKLNNCLWVDDDKGNPD
ncbi:cyclin-D1-1 isoform X1 [Manihot esculenta]|uniref:cyclin-D1-1 isoform X1 n=1 Tax=Manihot esculenta TaxID=3983 RepID=UPI001CC73085|nr:cyclin-D1-1 isoform X1 [Manihot esculenta]